MTETVLSRNGIAIRLTDERWLHISEEHAELEGLRSQLLDAIANPVQIFQGGEGELLAVQELELGKYIVVVYREFQDDGFVITAFLTRRKRSFERRPQVWP